MKPFKKMPCHLLLTIMMLFCLMTAINAQNIAPPNQIKQVVLNGREKTTTINEFVEEYEEVFSIINMEGLFNNEEKIRKKEIIINEFTVTFTPYEMRMDSKKYEHKFEGYSDVNGVGLQPNWDTIVGTVIFRFNREFSNLKMILKLPPQPNPNTGQIDPNAGPIVIPMSVPRSDTYTTSVNSMQLLSSNGVPSETLAGGYATQKHTYKTEDKINLNALSTSSIEKQVIRKDHGDVWLAPEADGMDTMNTFFEKMLAGGYDLGGGDKSGIMALMSELLVIGMPLKVREVSEFILYVRENNAYFPSVAQSVYKTTSEVDIFSISTSFIDNPYASEPAESGPIPGGNSNTPSAPDLDSAPNTQSVSSSNTNAQGSSQSDSQVGTNSSLNSQNRSSNNSKAVGSDECDCSCEAYAKFIKIAEQNKKSKKSKKKTDLEFMQEINLDCMQKCMMEWTKCMMIKN